MSNCAQTDRLQGLKMASDWTGFPAHSGFLRYSVDSLEERGANPPQLGLRSSIFVKTWEAPGSSGEFIPIWISCTFRLSPIFCRFPGGARSESSPARSTEFDLRENMGSSWKFRRISSENWRLIERDGAIQPGAASSMGPPKKGR